MGHTYKLVKAIISMEEKMEIDKSLVLESLSRVFLFICFPD